jgi:CDP-diacylglycerol pyrophosphatase
MRLPPLLLSGAVLLGALGLLGPSLARADPDALWKIVHGQCAPNMADKGSPAPCLRVDLKVGWAALKDRNGATQVLVIPTDKVTGIESPMLLRRGAPNYWRYAWSARIYVEKLAGRAIPREDLSLAVNSRFGRSQNQLHIHVDCLRPEVRDALAVHLARIGPNWSRFPMSLAGHRYVARRLDGADLENRDPFKLLAEADRRAREDMGRETLVVAGVRSPDGRPGFVLLADRADAARADPGSGEDLQDHACQALGPRPAAAPKP